MHVTFKFAVKFRGWSTKLNIIYTHLYVEKRYHFVKRSSTKVGGTIF